MSESTPATRVLRAAGLGLWKAVPCATVQCEGWVSHDFDYSRAPTGWGNLHPFLQDFYVEVFACEPVSSERDHKGPNFEALTGLKGGSFRGRHLRLPGHGVAVVRVR